MYAQPIGPCPIGYVVEEIPFGYGSLYFCLAEDGTAVIDARIYRAGVGELLPPDGFTPYAVNSSGVMAGKSGGGVAISTLDGLLAVIELPAGVTDVSPMDISDGGYTAGIAYGSVYKAFRVTPDNVFEILPTPTTGAAFANAVNSSGQVCGRWTGPGDSSSAFWDTDGTFYEIPVPVGYTNNEAMDINESGEVLIMTASHPPAIWSLSEGFRPLESSGDNYGFAAWGMNNLGHVVGLIGAGSGWVWSGSLYSFMSASLVDSDGWEILTAVDINDQGQIVGHAKLDGQTTLYLATPIGLCSADITTTGAPAGGLGDGVPDGEITGTDLSFFVNGWLVGDSVADVTTQNAPQGDTLYGEPDGIVTGADIQYYVNMWVSGCNG